MGHRIAALRPATDRLNRYKDSIRKSRFVHKACVHFLFIYRSFIFMSEVFMKILQWIKEIRMELTWITPFLLAPTESSVVKGRAMLDAIFIVLGVVIFAAACGYAALCDRM